MLTQFPRLLILFCSISITGLPVYQNIGNSNKEIKTYKINPAKSELIILVHKAGIASAFGHNHAIKADEYKGTIKFSEEALSSSSIDIEVNAGSLKADLPEMRRKYKLDGELSAGDMKNIESDMMAKDQLDTTEYHLVKFVSESIINNGGDKYMIFGDLTIHGITRKISPEVKIDFQDSSLTAYSGFKIKQSDFSIVPFSAALGLIKNKDEIQIIFNFTADLINSPR